MLGNVKPPKGRKWRKMCPCWRFHHSLPTPLQMQVKSFALFALISIISLVVMTGTGLFFLPKCKCSLVGCCTFYFVVCSCHWLALSISCVSGLGLDSPSPVDSDEAEQRWVILTDWHGNISASCLSCLWSLDKQIRYSLNCPVKHSPTELSVYSQCCVWASTPLPISCWPFLGAKRLLLKI